VTAGRRAAARLRFPSGTPGRPALEARAAVDPRARYRKSMDAIYLACITISAAALLVITLIIPYGVFMRYVLNSARSWPEPLAVMLMVVFTFVGGAAVYRAGGHIAVQALVNNVNPARKRALLALADAAMLCTAGFMLVWGAELVKTTWHQVVAEFPVVSVGVTYLPLPVGGLLTLLFIVEHIWLGPPPPDSVVFSDAPMDLE
jgi:TRAP-type C4-dicarboxylate transport system permease small subunit